MRQIKFDVCIRRKDGTDMYNQVLTLDELLERNGCLFNTNLCEVVYKRQYTGLKDKKRKEIYEGDSFEDGSYVVFNNGSFKTTYKGDNQGGNLLTAKRCDFIEVAGNIHENV